MTKDQKQAIPTGLYENRILKMSFSPHIWLLTDGKIGDRVQCLGVAQALGGSYEERIVSPPPPWRWIMPYGPVPWSDHPQNTRSPIASPFPDIVIGSGRSTIAYIRLIKANKNANTLTVILKDPRVSPDVADIIWVPEHDPLRGDNVIVTPTSPHGITQEILDQRRHAPLPPIVNLPKPRIAIILGDPTNKTFRPGKTIKLLVTGIRRLASQVGGFMLTSSRRTPHRVMQAVIEAIGDHPAWIHQDLSGPPDSNPYLDLLAHADGVVVTGDSHNMVSEALITGRPVSVFRPNGHSRKLAAFVDRLEQAGQVRRFDGRWYGDGRFTPVNATILIAEAIKAAFRQKTLINQDQTDSSKPFPD